jgi:hypothetical protein
MLIVIVAILIASAVSDSSGDRRAWLYVAIVATGYVVSRGLAKIGIDHWSGARRVPKSASPKFLLRPSPYKARIGV